MERPLYSPHTLEEFIDKDPVVGKAYRMAEEAHRDQKRDDGTPYIEHCKAVARTFFEEWGIPDSNIIAAGLLHDSVEDKHLSFEDIRREFGEKVEFWIDGVTKFEPPKEEAMSKELKDKKTFKKIIKWHFFDLIPSLIKLSDNLHNTRTLPSADEEKRCRNAKKTLNVYAPLAESLGMWMVKTELEDLAFKYADPENYERYSNLFNIDERTKEPFKNRVTNELEKIIRESGIEATVDIRENSLVRLKDKKEPFSNINDVLSWRVRVAGKSREEKRDNCYRLLGIMREVFGDTEDQSRFDDFYSTPKFNEYSAIQITLDKPEGAIEVAITSDEKENYNNWGVISLIHKGDPSIQDHVLKIVTTPTGQAKFLPPEANGLDFAYLINKKLAAEAVSITVDGIECPLTTVIPNGAEVMINRMPGRIAPGRADVEQSRPSTKKKAEKQYLEQKMHDVEAKGKEIVQKVIAGAGLLDLYDLTKIAEHSDKLVNLLNYSGSKRSLAILYRLVKYNVINENDLRGYLKKYKITKKDLGLTSILIEGKNKSDLLSFFSSKVGKLEGDIRWIEGGSAEGTSYYIRMVVQNLTPNTEAKIKQMFAKNRSVSKIEVV